MGFSRQEYWSGVPFLLPRSLPNPGIEPTPPVSPALQTDSLLLEPLREALNRLEGGINITLYVLGNQNNLCDLLYCNIHFTAVVWSQFHNISKVCLCIRIHTYTQRSYTQTQYRYNIVQRWYGGFLPIIPYQRFTLSRDLLGKWYTAQMSLVSQTQDIALYLLGGMIGPLSSLGIFVVRVHSLWWDYKPL